MSRLRESGAREVRVHDDAASHAAADVLGLKAFCLDGEIYLGDRWRGRADRSAAIVHELVHVLQTRIAQATGITAPVLALEREAHAVAEGHLAADQVRCGAQADRIHGLWWLLPLAAGVYTLLRPNNANAPTRAGEPLYPDVSPAQVAGEAFALFAVPGGALAVAGRLKLGFLATGALVGGSTSVSLRAVEDVSRGEFSGGQVYVFDAATGSLVGMVIPGGIRLVGRAGSRGLDWLANHGMRYSDRALNEWMFRRAGVKPLVDPEVDALLARASGWVGRSSSWWLNRRGHIILYRGQSEATARILSPLAREKGVVASRALEERLRSAGVSSEEIARLTATQHSNPVHPYLAPPGFGGERIGAVGIPTSRIPGVAAGFGNDAVVYVIRLPRGAAIKVPKWGLSVENEWVVLHEIPEDAIIAVLPAKSFPRLTANDLGQLVPGD